MPTPPPSTKDADPANPRTGIVASPAPNRWRAPAVNAVAGSVAAIAASTLAGWHWGFLRQGELVAGVGRVRPTMAVSFLGLSVALAALVRGIRIVVTLAAGFAGAVAALTLAQYLTGHDLGIDRLILASAVEAAGGPAPGRMVFESAVSTTLQALAIVLVDRDRILAGQILALVVLVESTVITLGYLYGAGPVLTIHGHEGPPLLSAVVFVALPGALLACTADRGLVEVVPTAGPAGVLVRRVLPVALAFLVATSWLVMRARTFGWYGGPAGAVLKVLAGGTVLTVIVLWTSRELGRAEAERDRATRSLEAAETSLAESEERFRLLFEHSPIGTMLVSLDPAAPGRALDVNRAWCELSGYDQDQLLGMSISELVPVEHRADLPDRLGCLEPGSVPHVGEMPLLRADGRTITVRCISSILGSGAHRRLAITQVIDITAQKRTEEELTRLAMFDALTGLANRWLFMDRLGLAIDQGARDGSSVALMFVDVDRLKDINDELGHDAGDTVLRAIGTRLRSAVRSVDTAARLAGDEFIVLCPHVQGVDDARRIAARLHAAVGRPVVMSGRALKVGTSMGVAVSDTVGLHAEALMRSADVAMYEAKRHGRDRCELYSRDLDERVRRYRSIEGELRDGLSQERFQLWFQPVLDLAEDRIVGTEALLRLDHPSRGLLLPGEFIDIAEDSALLVPIGEWVVAEACRQAAEWNRHFGPLEMAVNLSGRQVARHSTVDHVCATVARTSLDPGLVCVEVPERILAGADDVIDRELHRLAECGVRLAVDDAGSAWSQVPPDRFPISTVKIDRRFVAEIGRRPREEEIVRTITALAHDRRLTATAEGVEHRHQLAQLRSWRCDRAQGFLLHRPQPPDAITTLLEAQSRRA